MTQTTAEPGLVTGRWNIDPAHSEVTFNVRHLMTTVRGSFTTFGGSIQIADDVFASTAHAEIAMASIDTRNAERDEHLRSSEIFDVAAHPVMRFTTTAVSPARTGRRARRQRYNVEGDLKIRGIARPVRLLTEFHGTSVDQWGGVRAGFTASAQILRSEFGIRFNIPLQGDRLVLSDEIEVGLEIQAVLDQARHAQARHAQDRGAQDRHGQV